MHSVYVNIMHALLEAAKAREQGGCACITGGSQGPGTRRLCMHSVYVVVCSTHNILYNMTPVPACVIKTLLATVTRSTPSLAHLSHNPLLHTLSAHCHKSSPY